MNKADTITVVTLLLMFIVGGIAGYVEGTLMARQDCTEKCDAFIEEHCLLYDYDNLDYNGDLDVNLSGLFNQEKKRE